MPRRLIHRYLPTPEHIVEHRLLRFMGTRLVDPVLWTLHRRSAAGAMFIGLWCAMLPMPFQMVPAAALALLFRVNLPLAIVLCWASNPLTVLPLMWLAFWLGSHLTGLPMVTGAQIVDFITEITQALGGWAGLSAVTPTPVLSRYLLPFLLGTQILGILAGALGYVMTRLIWRWHVQINWHRRQARRQHRST